MQWLARVLPMGPDGSVVFGAAGLGPVPGLPVFALAFGTPFVLSAPCVGVACIGATHYEGALSCEYGLNGQKQNLTSRRATRCPTPNFKRFLCRLTLSLPRSARGSTKASPH